MGGSTETWWQKTLASILPTLFCSCTCPHDESQLLREKSETGWRGPPLPKGHKELNQALAWTWTRILSIEPQSNDSSCQYLGCNLVTDSAPEDSGKSYPVPDPWQRDNNVWAIRFGDNFLHMIDRKYKIENHLWKHATVKCLLACPALSKKP